MAVKTKTVKMDEIEWMKMEAVIERYNGMRWMTKVTTHGFMVECIRRGIGEYINVCNELDRSRRYADNQPARDKVIINKTDSDLGDDNKGGKK